MSKTNPHFQDPPFYPVSRFYKQKFGEKVFKIPVGLSGACPNMKDGTGLKTCIFCDQWGSFAYPENQEKSLRDQIRLHRQRVGERYNARKFFVYFQAYTTTYTQFQRIKEAFEVALSYPEVVGLVIGTRPDCLSPALLDHLNATAEKTFMALELGVQSFDDKQLKFMRRGHTHHQSLKAIGRIRQACPQVNLGIHLMFGWPQETPEDIINSAHLCNRLDLHNVKLHNLHVLEGTELARLHQQKLFTPIDREEYAAMVGLFLSHLRPDIAVHRLAATASRHEELVAPSWTAHKMENYQYIVDHMKTHQLSQGCRYLPPS